MQIHQFFQRMWGDKNYRWIIPTIGTAFFILMVWAVGAFVPEQIDWVRTYRPATRELLALRSPYNVPTYYNPPWILIPMIPMAILPDKVGNGVLFVVSFCFIVYSAIRFGAKPVSLLAFLLSFPVIFLLLFGQIDWMVLFGFTLPPQIGLLFILSKPQIGIPYAVFILVESWRSGGIKQVVKVFLPTLLLLIVSFFIFGVWFSKMQPPDLNAIHNLSIWPAGLPIGLALLIFGLRRRKKGLSIIAGPSFSPYVCVHSWSIPMLPILPMQWETIAAAIGSWLVCLIQITN